MGIVGCSPGVGFTGSVRPWDLTQLNPDQYLDFDLSTFSLNGAKVIQWGDLSTGGTYDAGQSVDANRPIKAATEVTFAAASVQWVTMPVLQTPTAWYALWVGSLTAAAAQRQVVYLDFGAGASGVQFSTTVANEIALIHPGVAGAALSRTAGNWASGTLCRREMGWDGTTLRYRENGDAWTTKVCAGPNYSGANPSSLGAYFSGVQPSDMTAKVWLLMARWPSAAELTKIAALSISRFGV